jgi:hypothetical protein
MINNVLMDLKAQARRLAKDLPPAQFYVDQSAHVALAWDMFFNHPVVLRLQQDSIAFLYDDYMFGIEHSKKVAQDAAAIILAEGAWLDDNDRRHLALLAQVAGLLHDLQREEADHAGKSSLAVASVLEDYPLSAEDRDLVARAVADHEADHEPQGYPDEAARLLARALHDADKFRYGGDIFATTMWLYCDYESWSLAEIAGQFPKGIEMAESLAPTLRTEMGREYGPEILRQGARLGRMMLEKLQQAARGA